MGTVISEGSLFRFEEICVPSPEWDEYRSQYAAHGHLPPEPFEDDVVRVIYFRKSMMGGYISSRRHMRYQSYIHPSDSKAMETFNYLTWDEDIMALTRVMSVNCLWRRKNSGVIGRIASMWLYLGIGSHAMGERCMIFAGAANPKLRSLYRTWNPRLSFPYMHHDGSMREMFLFHPDSWMSAFVNVAKCIVLLRWAKPSQQPHETQGSQVPETRKAA
jgi:hypothetical protein